MTTRFRCMQYFPLLKELSTKSALRSRAGRFTLSCSPVMMSPAVFPSGYGGASYPLVLSYAEPRPVVATQGHTAPRAPMLSLSPAEAEASQARPGSGRGLPLLSLFPLFVVGPTGALLSPGGYASMSTRSLWLHRGTQRPRASFDGLRYRGRAERGGHSPPARASPATGPPVRNSCATDLSASRQARPPPAAPYCRNRATDFVLQEPCHDAYVLKTGHMS